ncbi:MAG: formylmethanofuran dehydrogenase subunit B [Methylococcaceae bacterium]
MTNQQTPKVFENVPSPFCGIASDDLHIRVTGNQINVTQHGDPITKAGFETPLTDTTPRINGQTASRAECIALAARLLAEAHLPVFSGFGTDVNETRAALSLIERCRGIFDQQRSEGGLRNLLVLADSGWMATTLGELKNRAEVLVSFGTDIEAQFPRFFERFIWPEETLFGADVAQRDIIYIGAEPSGTAAISPDGRSPEVIPARLEDLPAIAATLAALAKNTPPSVAEVGGIPISRLQSVVDRMRSAHYSVVTWAAGQLNMPHAELGIQQICRMIVSLNQGGTRVAALPLGGQEGDRTASQVCTWISGYPTRVSYARGYPEYDPYHNGTARLLARKEADVLVWVSSLGLTPPPVTDIPTIVIGRSGMGFTREPEVFIPVGVPGIDFAGHQYRCDNVVALPLYALRESGMESATAILRDIEAAIT